MIPHVLVRYGATNGLRIRVVACRKRLRVLRAIHKAQIDLQMTGEGELETHHELATASAETSAVLVEESALSLQLLEGKDAQLT